MNNLHDVDQKLWELTRWLTLRQIPYNPPLVGERLANMRENNPAGYDKLMEYQRLNEIYRRLTEESTK
jgi:hypothetical protein